MSKRLRQCLAHLVSRALSTPHLIARDTRPTIGRNPQAFPIKHVVIR